MEQPFEIKADILQSLVDFVGGNRGKSQIQQVGCIKWFNFVNMMGDWYNVVRPIEQAGTML